ncbi:MAG: biotin/lipoyl-binding protein, partial [Candidatus Aminicenantes bacterium]|nr:biotin/lipoyl-binding protein [Candidatus Aminicenantes bacterium]
MAKEFRFPDVGEGITEGEIVRWLVKEGDAVQADQALAEIETDKAVVEMPSPYAGTVLKLHFKEKDLVKVGQALVTIGEKGEVPAEAAPAAAGAAAPRAVPAPAAIATAPEIPGEVLATPKVRALAKELGVGIGSVRGTGPGGR